MLENPLFGEVSKALHVNWGPPSETPSIGLPKRENASFSSLIMKGGCFVFFFSSRTSGKKEK